MTRIETTNTNTNTNTSTDKSYIYIYTSCASVGKVSFGIFGEAAVVVDEPPARFFSAVVVGVVGDADDADDVDDAEGDEKTERKANLPRSSCAASGWVVGVIFVTITRAGSVK